MGRSVALEAQDRELPRMISCEEHSSALAAFRAQSRSFGAECKGTVIGYVRILLGRLRYALLPRNSTGVSFRVRLTQLTGASRAL
jgi:hypothetical protein